MQVVVVSALVLLTAAAVFGARPHSTFYDVNFDIDSFLSNTKLVENYVNCLLDKRDNRCTREGKDLKHDLPDALKLACGNCDPGQRHRMRKVCISFKQKFPLKWDQIMRKFDAEGKNRKSFDNFLAGSD